VLQEEHLRTAIDLWRQVATLFFDYPEKMNMISFAARSRIRACLEQWDENPDVRVVVIRGAGGQFTAGGDIQGFMEQPSQALARLHDNIAAPERMHKPVIAAVDGYCFGVGFELALAGDFIIATRRSQFALPEARIGMMPGSGGAQRLLRILGPMRTKLLTMTGRRIPAAQAEAWGIISQVVPDGELDAALDVLITELLQASPLSLAFIKYTINQGQNAPLEAAMSLEGMAYGLMRSTEDFAEGVASFGEKRPPQFKGR